MGPSTYMTFNFPILFQYGACSLTFYSHLEFLTIGAVDELVKKLANNCIGVVFCSMRLVVELVLDLVPFYWSISLFITGRKSKLGFPVDPSPRVPSLVVEPYNDVPILLDTKSSTAFAGGVTSRYSNMASKSFVILVTHICLTLLTFIMTWAVGQPFLYER